MNTKIIWLKNMIHKMDYDELLAHKKIRELCKDIKYWEDAIKIYKKQKKEMICELNNIII